MRCLTIDSSFIIYSLVSDINELGAMLLKDKDDDS